MIEMSCPSCGRAGQVPREKLNSRLVCRKCHVVFHMDPNGRAIVGEPHKGPSKEELAAKDSAQHKLVEKLHIPSIDDLENMGASLREGNFPVKPALGVLGGLAAVWLIWSFLTAAPASIAEPARSVVEAVGSENVNRIKSYTSSDTQADIDKWYETVHTKLESAKKDWPTKETSVQVLVVEEDARKGSADVEAFITPVLAMPTEPVAFVPPPPPSSSPSSKPGDKMSKASKPTAPAGPVGFKLHWILEGGKWRIDGKTTLALLGAGP
jgi:hypothetical protein